MNRIRALALVVLAILLGLVWAGRDSGQEAILLSRDPDFGGPPNWLEGLAVWPSVDQPKEQLMWRTRQPLLIGQAHTAWNRRDGLISERALYAILTLNMSQHPMQGYNEDEHQRQQSVKSMVAWLTRGQQLDPGNGLYNLLLMNCYLEAAFKYPECDATQPDDVKLSKGLFGALTLPEGVVVRDERYLKEAIEQYRLALKKTVHTYQQQARTDAFRGLAKPVIYEQFVPRERLNEAITVASYPGYSRPFYYAVMMLAKRGDTKTAEAMLDIRTYLGMFPENWADFLCDADELRATLQGNAASLHDMAVRRRDDRQARYYLLVHQQLGRLKFPCFWPGYLMKVPADDSLSVEMGYSKALRVLVWLLMLGLIRQIFWAGWALIKRRSHQQSVPVPGVGKVAGITAGAYLVIAVVLMASIAGLRDSATSVEPLAAWLLVSPMVIGWFWVRWRYKSMCQQAGVAIPGRIQEVACNWIPVTLFIVLFVVEQLTNMKRCNADFRLVAPYGWVVFGVVVAVATWFKLRTADYYAAANRTVQHYLACLVMWASLVVMPILLAGEVVMLHYDHTGIGANKSVELLNERASKSSNQALLQIKDIVRNAK